MAFPKVRADFPALLNCLGLRGEAVEVGVQTGVHAHSFLQGWEGRRLQLVDKWSFSEDSGEASGNQMFYVDIANVHGADIRKQHRTQCEKRLAEELKGGRAVIVNSDSTLAAESAGDSDLDFVYLDARHDFAGVAADIFAWWPKVRVGGIFAGHDFVDGEFPEGDFFWISALQEVLPGIELHTHVTKEKNRYPSFFILKTEELASMAPRAIEKEAVARKLYRLRSRYFKLWCDMASRGDSQGAEFTSACQDLCEQDCLARAQEFTPTRTVGSTLRPFACVGPSIEKTEIGALHQDGQAREDVCAAEMEVDVQAYRAVCLERCNVTCQQRRELFSTFGADILAV